MESKKLAILFVAMVLGTLTPAFASRNEVVPLFTGGNANANANANAVKGVPQIRYVTFPDIFRVGSNLGADCLSLGAFCSPFSLPCCSGACLPVGFGVCCPI